MNRFKSIHILCCLILFGLIVSQEIIQSNVIINNGSTARSGNTKFSTVVTIGQTSVGYLEGVDKTAAAGFWSFLHLEPQAPFILASEGDYPDRIEVSWDMFKLSPIASNGFKIFRDGNLIGKVGATQYAFVDFDVTAGELYNYEVTASNDFGESKAGKYIGFVNPNGVITGRVETNGGLAASGAKITLSPNLGQSLDFKYKSSFEISMPGVLDSTAETSLSLSFWFRSRLGTKEIVNLSDSLNSLMTVSLINNDISISTLNNQDWTSDFSDFADSWTHVTIVVDTAYGELSYYLNSKLVEKKTLSVFTVNSTGLKLKLGDGNFSGKLDNLSIWNKALSKEDVKRVSDITLSGKEDKLLSSWSFDEGYGSKIYDLTGANYDFKDKKLNWSKDIAPIKVGAFSDEDGNYIVEGINYNSGTSFNVAVEKETAIGRSVKFSMSLDTLSVLMDSLIDLDKRYTLERWVKISGGDWQHFAESYDGLSKKSYLNGVESATHPIGERFFVIHDTVRVELTKQNTSGHFFKEDSIVSINRIFNIINSNDVSYDEIRIWSVNRTASQIQANYNKGLIPDTESLWAYFKLNEGRGFVSKSSIENMPKLLELSNGLSWDSDIPLDEFFQHQFNPSSRTATLNPSNTAIDRIDFTDISQIKVSGFVQYENTDLYQKKVEFLVDNKASSPHVETKEDGSFQFEFSPGSSHQIQAHYGNHSFSSPYSFTNLNQPLNGILFKNTTKRNIVVEIYGGNKEDKVNIGDFDIEIKTANNLFYKTLKTNRLNTIVPGLPPVELLVSVKPSFSNTNYFTVINFDVKKTNLVDSNRSLVFNYRSDMIVSIEGLPKAGNGQVVVEQSQTYPYSVKAYESYNNDSRQVDVLSARVIVNDNVSDTNYTVELQNGKVDLNLLPAFPNLASGGDHPYQKKLEVTATDETGRARKKSEWMLIEGEIQIGDFFYTTASQDMIMDILHVPPGDHSYAYKEKDSYSEFSIQSIRSREQGVAYKQKKENGPDFSFTIPIIGKEIKIAAELVNKSTYTLKQIKAQRREMKYAYRYNETFSTVNNPKLSFANPDLNRNEGDVFIGASLNFKFGKNISLDFNDTTFAIELDTVTAINTNSFKTTFAYTESYILNKQIPKLIELGNLNSNKKSYYYGQANTWANVLIQNKINKALVNYKDKPVIRFNFDDVFDDWGASSSTFERIVKTRYANDKSDLHLAGSIIYDVVQGIKVIRTIKNLSDPSFLIGEAMFLGFAGSTNYDLTDDEAYKNVLDVIKTKKIKRENNNVSFDAGSIYANSYEITSTETNQYMQEFYFDSKSLWGFDFESNAFDRFVGLRFMTQHKTENSQTNSSSESIKYGYVLSDNDVGDNFTVDVYKDPKFGSPLFKTRAGESSSPWEFTTVARNGLDFIIENENMINVDPTDPATTDINLANLSHTGEKRTYYLRINQATNPHGAKLAVNGIVIENELAFTIDPGKSIDAVLSIERGPKAYKYDDIELVFEAKGEPRDKTYKRFYNKSDTTITESEANAPNFFRKRVKVSAGFKEPVSEISLFEPEQNFLVNSSKNDTMWMTIADYDTTQVMFEKVKIQYRKHIAAGNKTLTKQSLRSFAKSSNDWVLEREILKDSLRKNGKPFYRFPIRTSHFPDAAYEFRAVTVSKNPDIPNGSSEIVRGIIDVHGPIVMGKPSPLDGILSADDEVSISFNEAIDLTRLTPGRISVRNSESGDNVNYSLSKAEKKLIFTFDMNDNRWIENKRLRIRVDSIYDVYGNILLNQIKNNNEIDFEFLVDRNPIRWVGGDIKDVKYTQESVSFERELVNDGNLINFTLRNIPSWLKAEPQSGSLVKGERKTIRFEISNKLVMGLYRHELYAESSFGSEGLKIDFRNLIPAPDWKVNPSEFSHSMNLTLELLIDSVQSRDIYDKIAVFEGEKLTGRADIVKKKYGTGANESTKYLAYLTVYSNNATEHDVEFRIWDASEGRILANKESRIPFKAFDVRGNFLNPVKLYTTKNLYQEYELKKGWNWVSFNLDLDSNLNHSLESIRESIIEIKNHRAFSAYHPRFGFLGSLKKLDLNSSYLVKLKERDRLRLSGKPLNLNERGIDLNAGWNTMAYFPAKSMKVDDALQNLLKTEGDIIKSQDEFAIYIAEFNSWIGSLTYLHPGQGYYVELAKENRVFKYPLNGMMTKSKRVVKKEERKAEDLISFWENRKNDYEHTMNVVMDVKLDKFDVKSKKNIIVGAFVGDECRGIGKMRSIGELKRELVFLSVSGKEEEELRFRVINLENRIAYEMEEKLWFSKDRLRGDLKEAFRLEETAVRLNENGLIPREFSLKQNYPNPFNPVTRIEYTVKERSEVVIEIYNTLGQRVRSLLSGQREAGVHVIEWNSRNDFGERVSSGIYFYRMKAGTFTMSKKMVLIK